MIRHLARISCRIAVPTGVPLLAPSVCRLNPDMPRGLAPEHTKPIGWAGSVSVVGRVDRLLAGKDAGLVQSRCLRAAHLGSAPAPPQLLSSSAKQLQQIESQRPKQQDGQQSIRRVPKHVGEVPVLDPLVEGGILEVPASTNDLQCRPA